MLVRNHWLSEQRSWAYLGFSIGLLPIYFLLRASTWQGSPQLHTLIEECAALLTLIIGAIALTRYYSRKNNAFLLIGCGFLGAGSLDAYHAFLTSGLYQPTVPLPPNLVAWSGIASRFLLSICLWLSWASWKREQTHGPRRISEAETIGVVGGLTICIFILLIQMPLPKAFHAGWFLTRPQELVPAFFFLLALVGYLRKGGWRQGAFEHWLILSLIAAFFSQAVFMATSAQLRDALYFGGHLLRIVSYLLVLTGLLISTFRLFRQAEAAAEEVKAANQALVKEVAERERAVTALRLDEQRMNTLLRLNEMTGATLQQLVDFALEEGVRLTGSSIGYLAFMNEDETVLTMHAWSKNAMSECAVQDKPLVYPIEQTGLWGEAVRQRAPVITNDYTAPSPLKKGHPEGHVVIKRHMNVPVFEGERIVAVAGVGNKEEPYNDSDVAQLRLLMTGMWQIIQRRQTEAALEASRQLFAKFMDHSPAAAFMKDKDGRMLYINATFERIFETTLAQIQGKLDAELWPPEVAAKLRDTDVKVLASGKAVEVLEAVPTPAMGLRQWLVFKFAFRDPQGELRLGGMAVDVTERHRAQEELRALNETLERRIAERTVLAEQRARDLERSNVELEQFAYVASHDLQEPLRSVASFTQLLARRYGGKLDKDADEFIHYIVTSAVRMRNMINDLLSYSRAGRADKPLAPTNCQAVFQEVVANLKTMIEEAGAQITCSELPEVMADASQLARLFQNLISNAIKFHGPTPPRVHVQASRQEGSWHFSIQDNGIGIEPEQFHRLFLIFQRLHDPAKYSGSGIGLAVCKKIVERHGGRIWAESKPGQGTTFRFTIPDQKAG